MTKRDDESRLIHEWGNVHTQKVRVSLTTYKGKRLLDIRRHFDIHNDGKLVPTRKGISLTTGEIPELLKALEIVARELKAAEQTALPDKTENGEG